MDEQLNIKYCCAFSNFRAPVINLAVFMISI